MPSLSNLNNSLAATEQTTVLIDTSVTFTDAEGDFNGGTITVSGLTTGDVVSVQNTGTSAGEIGFTSGTGVVTFGGSQIGTLSGGMGANAVITLNANATTAAVDALLENLTFTANSDTPTATRTLTIAVQDEAGNILTGPPRFSVVTGSDNPFNGVDVGDNVAGDFVDIDGDGDQDVFFGGLNSIRFFENTGSTTNPVFTERTGTDNPLNTLPTGTSNNFAPAFLDVDGDGDQDAIVGTGSSNIILYFENTGTTTNPSFVQRTGTANPFNGDTAVFFVPVSVDIDGDNDDDIFFGSISGSVFQSNNLGGSTFNGPFEVSRFEVDSNASRIAFTDIDGDGDQDAFVTENGSQLFFENTGSSTSASFSQRFGSSNPLNDINIPGFRQSLNFLDIDGDGDTDILAANSGGDVTFVRATPANTITVSVTAVDDAPTVSGLTASTVTEDVATNLDLSAVTITDPDTTGNITVTITATDTSAVLAAADGSMVGAGVTETASGNNVVTLVGTATDINSYLNTTSNITYTTSSNNNSADTLSIQATDGVSTPNAASTAAVNITAVNDAPTLGGTPADDTATEDVATAINLSAYNVADVEGSNITLTLAVDRGTLAATTGGGVTVANSGTASITLSGTAANLNTFLDNTSNITFTTASNDTTAATLTVTPNDGTTNGTADTVTINVTAANDAPAGTDGTITVTEDTARTFAASDFGFTDVDTGDALASVRIDTLPASSTGTIQLSGSAITAGQVIPVASIGNLTFAPASNVNGTGAASFTFSVNDGDAFDSSPNTLTVNITAVNDAPTLGGAPADDTAAEDVATAIDLSAYNVADAEGSNITLMLAVDRGTLAATTSGGVTVANSGTASITLSGTASNLNTFLDNTSNITFTTASNDTTAATLTVTPNDGTTNGTADTVTINVTAVNDAPTLGGTPTDETVTEDVATAIDLSAYNVADVEGSNITLTLAVDRGTLAATTGGRVTVANSGTASITLSGTAANLNTFLDNTSNITFTTASNDTTAATLTATPNDGTVNGTADTVSISVTAVNDTPTGSDNNASLFTNGSRTFAASDFGFSDVDSGDSLSSVRIDTLSIDNGTLQLSGSNVSAGQVISTSDIPNLVYTPSGTGSDSFTFSVNDGTTFDTSPNTFSLSVSTVPVSAPPVTAISTSLDNSNTTGRQQSGTSLNDRIGGTGGNDTLAGNNGADTLIGGAGNDFVAGGNGNDTAFAGPGDMGNDTVQGNSGNDLIGGGAGNDIIVGGTFSTSASTSNTGNSGDDTLFGGAGDDLIVAGSYNSATNTVVNTGRGDNTIFAGTGNDTVFGDDAQDILGGGNGDDIINAGGGNDIVYGGRDSGSDSIEGGNGNDQVFGGGGTDTVNGGEGADVLFGGAGDDVIDGGNDNDQLFGGAGNDNITGGGGADTFFFGGNHGVDVVIDFDTSEDILFVGNTVTDFQSLADIDANSSTATIDGVSGLLIETGNGNSILLQDVSFTDLTASNFGFG